MLNLKLASQASHLDLELGHLRQEVGVSIFKRSPLALRKVPLGLIIVPILDGLLELALKAIPFSHNSLELDLKLIMVGHLGGIDVKTL